MADREIKVVVTAQFELCREAAMRKDQAKFDKAFEFIRADSDPPDSAADGLRALSLKSYESYKLMIMSEHSKFISSELNSLKTQVYSTRDKFEYKGTLKDDIWGVVATLQKTEGEGWKFVSMHRATEKRTSVSG